MAEHLQFSPSRYSSAELQTRVLHLGLGNFQRAHQALYYHQACQAGARDWGVLGVSLRSPQVRDLLQPQGFAYPVWVRDQQPEVQLVRVLQGAYLLAEELPAILNSMALPHLNAITLTVTEKAYCLLPGVGLAEPDWAQLQHDLAQPEAPTTIYGLLRLLLKQRMALQRPLLVASCDNLSDNSRVLKQVLLAFLERAGEAQLALWVGQHCLFPCTMVDRIVPASPSELQQAFSDALAAAQLPASLAADSAAQQQWQQLQIPAFSRGLVSTENFSQWVMESLEGRAQRYFDLPGLIWAEQIMPYEQLKLRLLNAAHSLLACAGPLRGHTYVHEAIADPELRWQVQGLWDEAATTLQLSADFDLLAYQQALLQRFANPHLQHRLLQIAEDSSQKIPVRWLGSLRERQQRGLLSPFLSGALLSWMRFVEAAATGRFDWRDPRKAELLAALQAAQSWERLLNSLF